MPQKPDPRALLIALNTAPGLHRVAVCRLAQNLERWSRDDDPATARLLGIPAAALAKARRLRGQAAERAAVAEETAAAAGARLITQQDPEYPPALRDLYLPPPVLTVRGDPGCLACRATTATPAVPAVPAVPSVPSVAIVGSRKASSYGLEVADRIARDLATEGVVVVSGFALGIDAAAHRGALAVGGRTVAVLGNGHGFCYPKSHRSLGDEIALRGAVISELPWDHPPRPWCFPMRNRVIAGLAAGTLVVQATRRSGSLITAHHALELGREVWAVPGRVTDPGAVGPNALIQDGAMLVRDAGDILEALRLPRNLTLDFAVPNDEAARRSSATAAAAAAAGDRPQALPENRPPSRPRLQGTAGKILEQLPPGIERTPDELSNRLSIAVDTLLGELLELELTGWLERLPGAGYRRKT
jgi:DNA processing protein